MINLIDRLFINGFKGQAEVGIYSLAVRIASVIVFLMTAFQLAWPAFAYSIRDDNAAKRTYAYVLTYLLFITCWMSLAIGVARPLARRSPRAEGELRPLRRRGAAALLRRRGVLGLLGARDRHRPDAPDAAELGRERRRGAREHRRLRLADPAATG